MKTFFDLTKQKHSLVRLGWLWVWGIMVLSVERGMAQFPFAGAWQS